MDSTADYQVDIDRLRAGDAAAADRFIARAYGRLERLARKMLADFPRVRQWDDTGDVLHESYSRLRAALTAKEFGTAREFFRIAALAMRRQLLDLYRARFGPEGSGAHRSPGQPAGGGSTADFDPGDSTHEPARLAAWVEFHEGVESLPAEDREAVDLLWYQELPQGEAAALAGVSLATMKRRWLSARLRLRAVLNLGTESG